MFRNKGAGWAIIFFIAAISLGFAVEARAAKTPPPDGPYRVGVRIDYIEMQGRKMPVMTWYPAQPAEGAKPYLYNTKIKGAAVLNAPVVKKDAPYPMIIFSHGLGGCGCQSVFYTENLASFGYVVVAPDHRDSAFCHIDRKPDITPGQMMKAFVKSGGRLSETVMILFGKSLAENNYDFSYRSAEIKKVIDSALAWNKDASSPLGGMINPDKIGISGHSLGGFTSLMIGGVPFHCEKKPEPRVCNDPNLSRMDRDPCCIATMQNLSDPSQLADKRVKAMLPLSPAIFFPSLEVAAKEIKIPLMIITGDNKKMEVPWEPIWKIYTNAPAPKYTIRLKKTDHMTIADTARNVFLTRLFLPGFRSHFKDKAQAYKDYSVTFFNLYLKGDNSRAAILKKPSNRFVELWEKVD